MRALAPVEGARAHFQHAGGDAIDARCKQRARTHAARAAHERVRARRRDLRVRRRGTAEPGAAESGGGTVVYLVFDLLEFETEPLLDEPWKARRKRLEGLLDDRVAEVRLSRAYDDGGALRKAARARGLGIVAKRRTSRYRPARSATTGVCWT